jgi:hypothetical protein
MFQKNKIKIEVIGNNTTTTIYCLEKNFLLEFAGVIKNTKNMATKTGKSFVVNTYNAEGVRIGYYLIDKSRN